MILSVKVALVTCLGFIFGMSWLVSLVARPMVELPPPLVVRGPSAGSGAAPVADVAGRSSPDVVARRFAQPSPLVVAAEMNRPEEETLVVAGALPQDGDLEPVALPPLYVPEAPVIAAADTPRAEPAALSGAGSSVMTITSIPEAIITDAPVHGARMLAALVGGAEAAGETALEVAAATDAGRAPRAAREYQVQRGDTLVKIMRREWNSDDEELLEVLLAANPQIAKRRNRIFPGEVLSIPALGSSVDATRVRLTAAHAGPGGGGGRSVSARRDQARWYTIRKRDSLASIARRLLNDEARWREIAQLNQMRDANKILPGTRIKLPPVETDT